MSKDETIKIGLLELTLGLMFFIMCMGLSIAGVVWAARLSWGLIQWAWGAWT